MSKKIPIAAAERIAKEYGYEQVIIYARTTGEGGGEHMTTYGINKVHCDIAAKMGDALKKFIGWSGEEVGALLRKIGPAIIRPGMYAGVKGARTDEQWRVDAARAYISPPSEDF